MKNFFTIIGGMGTIATESFVHSINEKTQATNDQDFLNYILVNHASIPDRTNYITNHNNPNPFFDLSEDIKQQSQLNPNFFVLPCNTAHYFYQQLQALTDVPILNMLDLVVQQIKKQYPKAKRIGILATNGTLKSNIYSNALKKHNYEVVLPTKDIKDETTELIYKNIKENNTVDQTLFLRMLEQMQKDLKCDVIILGCTELSVAHERTKNSNQFPIIDSQDVLAQKTVELATNKGLTSNKS